MVHMLPQPTVPSFDTAALTALITILPAIHSASHALLLKALVLLAAKILLLAEALRTFMAEL